MVGADNKRSVWRSNIERLWGGEPVYSMEKLRQSNQSWRARTNYRGLEGLISTENALDYDLETQGEGIIDINLEMGTGQEPTDWEFVMECQFKWLMHERWKGFNYHIPKRHYQKNLHGMGFHVWTDTPNNWIPRTPCIGEVFFPDNCPLNFDEEGDFFMLRDFMPSYVLFNKIKNRKEADDLGWDVDMVWKALTQLDKNSGQNTYGISNAEWAAKKMNQGDIGNWSSSRQSGVWINSIFCREYETGKVSQYAVAEGLSLNEYLFKKRNKYEQWPIEIFPYDIGNGTVHSVKGLGDRTKEFFEMENRVRNAMVDQVQLGAYPSMKQTIQNMDPDKMKLAKVGGMTWLPYGAEPQVIQFPDLDKGPLALLDNLKREMQDNNRGIASSHEIEQQDRMTGQEYAMRAQDINHLQTSSVNMQKSHLDSFYNRILRLVCKSTPSKAEYAVIAKEFRDRCMAQGVPEDAFKSLANGKGEIRAVLAYGKGSSSARTNAYMSLFQSPVYSTTSDDRKIAIERGYVASMLGYGAVERYCRSDEDNELPDGDDSFAVQENNALAAGGDALAAPRQNQTDHLQIHFGKVGEIVQASQEGQMDPQTAYAAVNAFGVHIKQHLDFLRQNPLAKMEYQQFYNQWQALSRIADKLRADIESAAEATPPEQQVSEDYQLGMAKVAANERVAMTKVQGSTALKFRQQATREMMERQKLAAQQERDNIRTGHEIQRSNIETAATIAQDTALTHADIENKAKKNGSHE